MPWYWILIILSAAFGPFEALYALNKARRKREEAERKRREEKESKPENRKIMISACLLGQNCKYNGGNNRNPELLRLLEGYALIPVCPEVLGGLPVPRTPAEIVNGRVMNRNGEDVDAAFRRGAEKALALAEKEQPELIVLQSRSPSCGVNEIYDGTFSNTLVPGRGVFAEAAKEAGFRIADAGDMILKARERELL